MGIPILVRRHLYIETVPWYLENGLYIEYYIVKTHNEQLLLIFDTFWNHFEHQYIVIIYNFAQETFVQITRYVIPHTSWTVDNLSQRWDMLWYITWPWIMAQWKNPSNDVKNVVISHLLVSIKSLAHERCGNNFKSVIFKLILQIFWTLLIKPLVKGPHLW